MEEKLIIQPLNGVYFAFFGIMALFFVIIHLTQRKTTIRHRGLVLSDLMMITIVVFIVYKFFLSYDKDFSAINMAAGLEPFSWWSELPLQLCNINMLMIPIAIQSENRRLQGFCFFSGTIGALMALLMPCTGFECYSILLPRIFGYYFTHWMVFFGALSLMTLGIFKPRFRDIPGMLVIFFSICLLIYGLNMLLRYSGLSPRSNYWFNVETEGNAVLELFYSWFPYPFLYTLPGYGIIFVYMLIVTTVYRLFNPDAIKERKKKIQLKNAEASAKAEAKAAEQPAEKIIEQLPATE